MTKKIDISDPEYQQQLEEMRQQIIVDNYDNPVSMIDKVYQVCWHWANFELYIVDPFIEPISPPVLIQPESLGEGEYEFVYPIADQGYRLSTSKAQEMFSAGMSMCKLHFTIEKMISILIERLKLGGISSETEVQVAFGGYEKAQRKAFESIINLNYNVVVTNFEPGIWGERYLKAVKIMAERGYGYPSESPRQPYLKHTSAGPKTSR